MLAYFRGQAAICLRWAKVVVDEQLKLRLLRLAAEFEAKANALEHANRSKGGG
jgi:hypothetical protein